MLEVNTQSEAMSIYLPIYVIHLQNYVMDFF